MLLYRIDRSRPEGPLPSQLPSTIGKGKVDASPSSFSLPRSYFLSEWLLVKAKPSMGTYLLARFPDPWATKKMSDFEDHLLENSPFSGLGRRKSKIEGMKGST